MNTDTDMDHVRGASTMREEQEAGRWTKPDAQLPRGLYGDSQGGKSFTDEQATLLETTSKSRRAVGAGWYEVWAGPSTTKWTLINTAETTEDEIARYEEAASSDSETPEPKRRIHPAQIAAEVPYTGYTTLVVFADGTWLSPADAARLDDGRKEAGRYTWGKDECGVMGYTDVNN